MEPVGAARVERAGETNGAAAAAAEEGDAMDTGKAADAACKSGVSDIGPGNAGRAGWTDGCALIVEATEAFLVSPRLI